MMRALLFVLLATVAVAQVPPEGKYTLLRDPFEPPRPRTAVDARVLRAPLVPVFVGQVLRVVDGDTLVVHIIVWPEPDQLQTVDAKVRIDGIDTPEIHHAACPYEATLGLEAMQITEQLLPSGTEISLRGIGHRDKYGRLLATVVRADGINVGEELIRLKHAVEYHGKTKASWCVDAPKEPRRGTSGHAP